jgi:hypothetical protein
VRPDPAPWSLQLVYHLAGSIARHTNASTVLLDLTGMAASRPPQPSIEHLTDRIQEAGHGSGAGTSLRVIAAEGDRSPDWPGETIGRLLKQTRHLLVLASRPPESPDARRADYDVRIEREGAIDAGAHGPGSNTLLVLVRDSNEQPAVKELVQLQERFALPLENVAIVSGGESILLHDGAQLPELTAGAIDRLARRIAGLRVGLALGGGGAKGFAHIGVLRGLERAGVPLDCVAGCSIGAPIAAGVAAGWAPDQLGPQLERISRKAIRPAVPILALLASRSIRREIQRVSNDLNFEDLPMPLSIVAADIHKGEEVAISRGPIWPAIMASMGLSRHLSTCLLGTALPHRRRGPQPRSRDRGTGARSRCRNQLEPRGAPAKRGRCRSAGRVAGSAFDPAHDRA